MTGLEHYHAAEEMLIATAGNNDYPDASPETTACLLAAQVHATLDQADALRAIIAAIAPADPPKTDAEITRLREVVSELCAELRQARGDEPARPLDLLRDAVRVEGGEWTVRRGHAVLGHHFSPERMRQLFNALADEGLLVKHGRLGRLWTPVGPQGQPAPAQADEIGDVLNRASARLSLPGANPFLVRLADAMHEGLVDGWMDRETLTLEDVRSALADAVIEAGDLDGEDIAF